MANPVEFEVDDGVALVTLNRPEKKNALSEALQEELLAIVEAVETDPDVRAVVLHGAGDTFCAGADIDEFRAGDRGAAISKAGRTLRLQDALESLPKPTIAAIDGYALGGGLELAACHDFRIATERATLGLPEVNLGMIPGAGGTQRLARLVGVPKAKELVFSGEHVSAAEAEAIGLVERTVPDDALVAEARAFAARFADKPPVALGVAKLSINKVWTGADLEHGLLYEALAANVAGETEDRLEGLAAFAEGREAEWRGR